MATFIRAENGNKAWEEAWHSLTAWADTNDRIEPSRGGDVVAELLNVVLEVEDSTRAIVTSPIRNMPMRYAVGELLCYLAGTNKLSDFARYSPFWEQISDNGKTVNSAYGYRMESFFGFNQIDYIMSKLNANPFDRQAVVHIKDASNIPTKDTPCTVCLQFFIRPETKPHYDMVEDETVDKLHMTVYMRSNDVWKGLPYDMFCFTALQQLVAIRLGVEPGTYTHHAASLHLYKADWEAYNNRGNTNAEKAEV